METTIEGARGVILNVVGGKDLTIDEVTDAAELVKSVVDASANIIFGARIDPNVQDEVEITVIATGFPGYDTARRDDDAVRGYNGGAQYDEGIYGGVRRMSVSEPYYKTVQPVPAERPVQYVQPVQPVNNDEINIERQPDKNVPKFAQLLKNFGKKRDN